MPRNFEAMLPFSFDNIADQVIPISEVHDPTPMRRRLSQTFIAILAGDEQIEARALNPLLDLRLLHSPPRKSPRNLRLINSIDSNRLVHRGSAKQIATVRRADIFQPSLIDQHRIATIVHE